MIQKQVYQDLLKKQRDGQQEKEQPGFWRALTDPKYRMATFIVVMLAVTN